VGNVPGARLRNLWGAYEADHHHKPLAKRSSSRLYDKLSRSDTCLVDAPRFFPDDLRDGENAMRGVDGSTIGHFREYRSTGHEARLIVAHTTPAESCACRSPVADQRSREVAASPTPCTRARCRESVCRLPLADSRMDVEWISFAGNRVDLECILTPEYKLRCSSL